MKNKFVAATGLSLLTLCFCGCLMYNVIWRIRLHYSETPMIIYNNLGVTATEWGTQLVHRVEFDLSNTAITSVLYSVNGETGVLYNRNDMPTMSTPGGDVGTKFIEGGESWDIFLSRGCTNDGWIACVNNCSSNTIIYVRMNEVEFAIPCDEIDFVDKFGTNYWKTIVRGML